MGDLGISPADFYCMSIKEVSLAIKGKNSALERDYNLMMIACLNANGMIQGGKKFKVINPFKNSSTSQKPKITKEVRDNTLEFLRQFNE